MHDRFEGRIREGLDKLAAACVKRAQSPIAIAQRVGRLLGQNSRAAGLFAVDVGANAQGAASGKRRRTHSGISILIPMESAIPLPMFS